MLLFSRSVMSNSLQPHELRHVRPPCPSPSPSACSNPCPLSRWCPPTISFSVASFSSCPQYFPESGSFSMSHLFTSGGLSIGGLALALVLPSNIQGWFPLGWTVGISCSPRNSQKSSPTHNLNASVLQLLAFFMVQLSHLYMTTGKTIALIVRTFVSKVISLLCNTLSRDYCILYDTI